jgi:triosephosphate isomerase
MIAGNWKMNTGVDDGVELVKRLAALVGDAVGVETVVAPPFISLYSVGRALGGTRIKLAAQDVCYADKGAYTGEISAGMLKALGCEYVIIGHSERRGYFHETDVDVNRKIKAAVAGGLKPIVCVGESLKEREAGSALMRVAGQARAALGGVDAASARSLTIAYEPIWAIGTGKTATPADAQEVHRSIRALLVDTYDAETAESMRIIYGGSAKPDNIDSLMAEPDIDGALVGGASLEAEGFARMVNFKPAA